MSRTARVQDGFLSTLMREQSRANHSEPGPQPGGAMSDTRPSTALLVMDFQRRIVTRYARDGVVERAAEAAAAARASGVPVIYVRVAFRPGHPEVSPRNRMFAGLRDVNAADDDGAAIHPGVAPEPGDVVVTKRRVSAFAGSDLDVVLRAGAIDHLVLCGIATSGVVLSTLRAAADLDFGLTVLRDACADADAEVHRVLVEKVFPRQAEVLDVAEWTAAVATAQPSAH
jgi:nicotinamidase-related amidase